MSLADCMVLLVHTMLRLDRLSTLWFNKELTAIKVHCTLNARSSRPACSLHAHPAQLARMHCGVATATARLAMPPIHHATRVHLVALVSTAV
jgi:hypothetical protein